MPRHHPVERSPEIENARLLAAVEIMTKATSTVKLIIVCTAIVASIRSAVPLAVAIAGKTTDFKVDISLVANIAFAIAGTGVLAWGNLQKKKAREAEARALELEGKLMAEKSRSDELLNRLLEGEDTLQITRSDPRKRG
jgi:hypothetical protein